MNVVTIREFEIYPDCLSHDAQSNLVDAVRSCLQTAPLFQPTTPRGKAMSVRMSAAGAFGWVSDRSGYRYEPRHPSGVHWPPIPDMLLDLWHRLAPDARDPECCLINWYAKRAKMGMHQDKDEADFSQPVLSVSLGDDALFRMGNATRGGTTESVWLRSGDVVVMRNSARRAYHGIDRVKANSSTLLRDGGRINLTLRVVT